MAQKAGRANPSFLPVVDAHEVRVFVGGDTAACRILDGRQDAPAHREQTATTSPFRGGEPSMAMQLRAEAAQALHPPIRQFSGSHDHIVSGLRGLQALPGLADALQRARTAAAATLDLFDREVIAHHQDEEQELFVAVQRSCRDGREAQRVRQLVDWLTAEHRMVEAQWRTLRPAVVATAAGKPHRLPDFAARADQLVQLYLGHARREEQEFLPLADTILARNDNHMAALDVALHLRHRPLPRAAYL